MDAQDNTKDLIELLGGNDEDRWYPMPCGWGWYARESFDKGYCVVGTGEGIGVRKTTLEERKAKLINPDGTPKEVLCFDNGGETWDRYTVLFTGPYIHTTLGVSLYVGMSAHPFNPQGFGQHGECGSCYVTVDDHTDYAHWGKKIEFKDLPEDCRRLVMDDYNELWDLQEPNHG